MVMFFLLVCFSNISAAAQDTEATPTNTPAPAYQSALSKTISGRITRIMDPLRIEIDKKHIVQLANLDVPDFTVHDFGPVAQAVKTKLDTFTGQKVTLYQSRDKAQRKNRMGYDLAQIIVQSTDKDSGKTHDIWLQKILLEDGYARLYPTTDNLDVIDTLKIFEQYAITNHHGLWLDARYTPLQASTLNTAPVYGRWAIVDGTVKKTAAVKNRIYLNFGDNWRTDFTISISSHVRRDLAKRNINPLDLGGKHVRVHGWLEDYNGASITLTDAAWLDITPQQNKPPLPPQEDQLPASVNKENSEGTHE